MPLITEQIRILCERVASENDPVRFMELVSELNEALRQHQSRVSPASSSRQIQQHTPVVDSPTSE
jgi:hypothetical protein